MLVADDARLFRIPTPHELVKAHHLHLWPLQKALLESQDEKVAEEEAEEAPGSDADPGPKRARQSGQRAPKADPVLDPTTLGLSATLLSKIAGRKAKPAVPESP